MAQQTVGEKGEELRPSLNRFLYLICAVIGMVLIGIGSGYKAPNVGLLGPAVVPVLVGGLLVFLSLAPIAAELFAGFGFPVRSPAGGGENDTSLSRLAILRIAALLAICAFFAVSFEFLGFALTASVSVFAAILVLGGKPVTAAFMAIILPVVLWVGFVNLLGLTLPVGDLFYPLIYS